MATRAVTAGVIKTGGIAEGRPRQDGWTSDGERLGSVTGGGARLRGQKRKRGTIWNTPNSRQFSDYFQLSTFILTICLQYRRKLLKYREFGVFLC